MTNLTTGFSRNSVWIKMLWIITIFALGITSTACGSSSASAVSQEKSGNLTSNQKQQLQSLINRGLAFAPGTYAKGLIPVGEFAFVSPDGGYYSEEVNGQIIDNANFNSFGYVYSHGLGNIKTGGFLITKQGLEEMEFTGAKAMYETIVNQSDYNFSGYYKVGVDILAGEYVVQSVGQAYVAIQTGAVSNSEILENDNFTGSKAITIYDDQYLELSNATISN